MKTARVSQISVRTSRQCEEPVAALLETIYGENPSIYSNIEKNESVVTLYKRANTAELKLGEAEVATGLKELQRIGLDIGLGEVAIRRVKAEDWSESWKKYFKTIEMGRALLIKPSWSRQKPKKGQAVVVLDPGLSFGTGQHATTSFCLKQISALRPKSRTRSFLDIGTGSGILAISAAKLGYAPVHAFDFDPVSVKISKKNCRTNRVETKVSISRKDLTRLPLTSREKYDVICANLISTLLLSERRKILNRVAPQGTIVLAGILETEFAKVKKAYELEGLRLVKSTVEREWHSGAFKAP